jgi:hypothetical protein
MKAGIKSSVILLLGAILSFVYTVSRADTNQMQIVVSGPNVDGITTVGICFTNPSELSGWVTYEMNGGGSGGFLKHSGTPACPAFASTSWGFNLTPGATYSYSATASNNGRNFVASKIYVAPESLVTVTPTPTPTTSATSVATSGAPTPTPTTSASSVATSGAPTPTPTTSASSVATSGAPTPTPTTSATSVATSGAPTPTPTTSASSVATSGAPTPTPTTSATSVATSGAPTPSAPAQSSSSAAAIEDDGAEDDPYASLRVTKQTTGKYKLMVSSNLADEKLVLSATKKGFRSISYRVLTDESGDVSIVTNRNLSGFTITLRYDGEFLTRVRIP